MLVISLENWNPVVQKCKRISASDICVNELGTRGPNIYQLPKILRNLLWNPRKHQNQD